MSDAAALGRPSDYKPEFVEEARQLCALGATDFELAEFFGVDTRTIYRWKNSHPDFCQAVIVGKERADERVERSLYNRAVGYSFESEEIRVLRDGAVVRVPIVEHVAPEPGAAFNWLKNRKPDEWRDRRELTGKDGEALLPAADPRELSKAVLAIMDLLRKGVKDDEPSRGT